MSVPMRYIYAPRRGSSWTERQKDELVAALNEVVDEVRRDAPPSDLPLRAALVAAGVELVDLRSLPNELKVLLLQESDRAFVRVMGFAPTDASEPEADG